MGRIVKKTIELNQDYIDRARVIFGVRTDKAAVNKALRPLSLHHAFNQPIGGRPQHLPGNSQLEFRSKSNSLFKI